MAEIVNLRRAKKAKARAEAGAKAAANRSLHGIPKAERERAERLREKQARDVDAHKRDQD